MTINDFLIPIFILIILGFIVFKFRKLRMNNNENFYIRIPRVRFFRSSRGSADTPPASGSPQAPQVPDAISGQNYNFSNKQINIGKNLFVGFTSTDESEKQLTMLKDAKMIFQDKMKEVNPGSNSIILKGQSRGDSDEKKYVNNICLGYNTGKIAPNYCINHSNLKKFEYENTGIPIYRDAGGRQIIYGNENEPQRHSKLCFYDRRRGETLVENMSTVKPNAPPAEHCIEAKDLDKINGKKAVKLKVKQGNSYKTLNPTNVEYGPWPGFGNTAVRTFFMTDDDYKDLRDRKLPASRTCYRPQSNGKNWPHHISPAHTPWRAKGSFYLSPIENDHGEYSHIHA